MRIIRIRKLFPFSLLFTTLVLNGCTSWLPEPHKIDIQQGNVLSQADRDSLSIGMLRFNVKKQLGLPALQDPFHPDRWDYIYTLKKSDGTDHYSRLTIFFENDAIVRIDDTGFVPKD